MRIYHISWLYGSYPAAEITIFKNTPKEQKVRVASHILDEKLDDEDKAGRWDDRAEKARSQYDIPGDSRLISCFKEEELVREVEDFLESMGWA